MTREETLDQLRMANAAMDPVVDMLASESPHAVASRLCALLEPLGAGAGIAYSAEWPQHIEWVCAGNAGDGGLDLARSAAVALRTGVKLKGAQLLCDDGQGALAVAMGSLSRIDDAVLAAARQRMRELLTAQRLRAAVAQLAQAERLQHALFAIADMAGSDLDMTTMLSQLHGIVG
ncbi:MAG: hypothetical protein AVDCRST_MAG71-824, partial [uncultured Lysobacter sp.]